MSDNILEPNVNGYPAVTDWEKVIVVLQQANELLLRGASIKDLSKWIIGDIEIQGSDFYDLPVAETSDPVSLPIPETGNKFGFLANGKFTQPTGGPLEYSSRQWGLTLFDGEKWVKRFTLDLPQVTGVDVINPTGSELPKEKAVANYVEPIKKNVEEITSEGKNRADKSKIVFGSWSNIGVFSGSTNRLAIILHVVKDKDYVVSGLGSISSQSTRLTFFAEDGSFSSNVFGTGGSEDVSFKAPITGTVGIYIVNATTLGNDPTNNTYANRFQVEYGTVSTAYESFKRELKLPTDLARTADVQPLRAITEPSKNLIDKSKIVGGQYSEGGILVPNDNRLAIRIDNLKNSVPYTLSRMGVLTSAQRFMVIPLKAGGFRVVYGDGTITPKTFTLAETDGNYVLLNLANVSDIGKNPTNNSISNVVQLEEGSEATDYQAYGLKVPAKNITGITVESKSDVYVDFHPTAYQGRERLIVYTRRGKSDYYIGHIINHELDTSEIVYSNQFRITRANEFKLVGTQMIFIAADVIYGGESECVYMHTNPTSDSSKDKADFTGGVHGDEQLIFFDYYVDGVKQDKTLATGLVACKTAWYIQKSSMHETAWKGDIVISGHPIEAYHYKKTIFNGDGYETINELEWVKTIPYYWYYGICCVGKYNGNYAMNEKLVTAPMVGTLNTFFDLTKQKAEQDGAANGWTQEYIQQRTTIPNSNTLEYYSSVNKKGVTMTAHLFSDYLTLSKLFIHDRANDSKGYAQTEIAESQLNKRDRSVMKIIYR